MLALGDKGSIKGKRSNFRISKILIFIAIYTLKLHEKSIGDSPRAQKCLIFKIKGL